MKQEHIHHAHRMEKVPYHSRRTRLDCAAPACGRACGTTRATGLGQPDPWRTTSLQIYTNKDLSATEIRILNEPQCRCPVCTRDRLEARFLGAIVAVAQISHGD